MEKEKFYLTTAIAYTSRKPHIGNTYEVVLSDAIARFNKKLGKDNLVLGGLDFNLNQNFWSIVGLPRWLRW